MYARVVKSLAVTCLSAVVMCAQQAAAAPIELRLASVAAEGSTQAAAEKKFAEYVAAATKGALKVNIFDNSALGGNREVLEMVRLGSIDFAMMGSGHAAPFVPQVGAAQIPYGWKSRESMFAILDGPVGQRLGSYYLQKGFMVLGWWDNGFRNVSNNIRPIMKVEDFKGLKLRTLPAKVQVEFFKAVGAMPTALSFSELIPALQQGVLDGEENPASVIYDFKIYEVQKFVSLTRHMNEPLHLLMSKVSFDRLPKDQQFAVEVSAHHATLYQRQPHAQHDAELLEALKKTPTKVNDVPEATLAELREIAKQVIPESISALGEGGGEIVDAMLSY